MSSKKKKTIVKVYNVFQESMRRNIYVMTHA